MIVLHSDYYAIPRTYMKIVGTWPFKQLRKRIFNFVLMFTLSFSIIVPQMSYLLFAANTLDDVFECIPSISITIIFSYKIFSIMINEKKIKACLQMIDEDWESLTTDVQRDILSKQTVYGQYMSRFYAVIMFSAAFFWSLKSVIMLLSESKFVNETNISYDYSNLPFRVKYGKRLEQYFYPIVMHCYLATIVHAFATISVDSLYFHLVQHVCGMLSIIGHTLKNIGADSDLDFPIKLDKSKDENYKQAFNCLHRHLRVMEFVEMIESLFTYILFVAVMLNMIGGGMVGIQVMMNSSNFKDIAGPLAIYIAQIMHLFLQFWPSQFLMDYSVVPYESICAGNWYHTSLRCRKILLLIMSRTVIPYTITAGKMISLSIETFGVVLKTSMSYFMMFQSFQ